MKEKRLAVRVSLAEMKEILDNLSKSAYVRNRPVTPVAAAAQSSASTLPVEQPDAQSAPTELGA